METKERKKLGKKSKQLGAAFELRVRKDLEEKGWIVAKWTNSVDILPDLPGPSTAIRREDGTLCQKTPRCTFSGKLVKAKAKWAGPNRPMMMSAGFPDFVAFKTTWSDPVITLELPNGKIENIMCYANIGVESKLTGELTREEKEKCTWLINNNVFSKILIAEKTKVKNKVVIIYHDFKEDKKF